MPNSGHVWAGRSSSRVNRVDMLVSEKTFREGRRKA